MVSPRKRILQASTSTRPTTATGTPTTTTAANSRAKTRSKIPLAFEKYKFYLDIRGKAKASLIEDLKNLGGVSLIVDLIMLSTILSTNKIRLNDIF